MFQLLALFATAYALVQHTFQTQNSLITEWMSEAKEDTILSYATTLTTQFKTRHAKSSEGLKACQWVKSNLESLGFEAELVYFMDGYNPNIVATLTPSGMTVFEDPTLVVGAHIDNRQNNINDINARAPGANDDGSGSSAVLTLATLMSGRKFKFPIALMLFNGEEQGLYGSDFMAKKLKKQNASIIGMVQTDMVGYHTPGSKPGLALVDRYTDVEFTTQARRMIEKYQPELELQTSSACCSDHQPFLGAGFRSIGLVEPGGYAVDPEYHSVNDTVTRKGYSIRQILLAVRALQSLVGEFAVIEEV